MYQSHVARLNGAGTLKKASSEQTSYLCVPRTSSKLGQDARRLCRAQRSTDVTERLYSVGMALLDEFNHPGPFRLRGAEGQPIVVSDFGGKPMLFMVSGCPSMANCNVVQALDLTNPDQPKAVWNYVKQTDRDESAIPRACCDTVNRGLNYAKGKIITHTLDGFVIALVPTFTSGAYRSTCLPDGVPN